MALARLALRSLVQQKILSTCSPSLSSRLPSTINNCRVVGVAKEQLERQERWGSETMIRRFSTTSTDEEKSKSDREREVAVSEGTSGRKKSKLFPKNPFRRRRGLWKNRSRDVTPFDLHHIFPSGLGDALLQASENLNRLFENLAPSRLIGRLKEDDKCYKLRFQMPGLAKEDVKITVEDDALLVIRGEQKEEYREDEERSSSSDEDDEEYRWYGYYNTILIPDDAKVEDIKAEMKDGILTITIPRTETHKKEVKEVKID